METAMTSRRDGHDDGADLSAEHASRRPDELVEMAKVAGRYGGIYATHMRDEGKDLIAAIDEAIAIGERGGLPVEIFHLKAAWQPGWGTLMKQAGQTIDAARARGVDVAADMYVYTAGGTGLEATIPTWAQEGGRAGVAQAARRSGDARAAEARNRHRRRRAGRISSKRPAAGTASCSPNARNRTTRSSKASRSRRSRRSGTRIRPTRRSIWSRKASGRVMAIYHMMSEPDVETALRFPWTSIGSDSGAAATDGGQDPTGLTHPRAYGNFPRVIAHYVRERGVLTLEAGDPQDDVMAGHPHAPRRPRRDSRRPAGPTSSSSTTTTLQDRATYDEPRRQPGRHRLRARQRADRDRSRQAHRRPRPAKCCTDRASPNNRSIMSGYIARPGPRRHA